MIGAKQSAVKNGGTAARDVADKFPSGHTRPFDNTGTVEADFWKRFQKAPWQCQQTSFKYSWIQLSRANVSTEKEVLAESGSEGLPWAALIRRRDSEGCDCDNECVLEGPSAFLRSTRFVFWLGVMEITLRGFSWAEIVCTSVCNEEKNTVFEGDSLG